MAGDCGLSSSFLVTNPTCNGLSNGEATVLLTGGNGPFTYEWSSSGTDATETGLGAGTYTVTITDVNQCEITDEVTLDNPPPLNITLETVVNTSCVSTPAGSATVSVVGGTGVISVASAEPPAAHKCQFSGFLPHNRPPFRRKFCKSCS